MNPRFDQIQTDFTKLQAGDWFFPVTLKDYDQHVLIPQALAKGIGGLTYEEGHTKTVKAITNLQLTPHFSVPSLREYLFEQARQKRKLLSTDIATISGSNGKTTVKEILGAILQADYSNRLDSNESDFFINPDNQNTKIALATQILRLPLTCPKAVFEVGARRPDDFKIPLSFVQPRHVALLNIGSAHVGEFGSFENLQNTKLSVMLAPSAENLIVPYDDKKILEAALKTGKNIVSFGQSLGSTVRVFDSTSNSITLQHRNKNYVSKLQFCSASRDLNIAAAVSVALSLSIPWPQILTGLENFKGVARRFQSRQWGQTLIIDDAFNASPESLKEGLKTLARYFLDRKLLLVLGAMLELGEHSESEHRKAAHYIKTVFPSQNLHLVTVGKEAEAIGDEWRILEPHAPQVMHFATSDDAKITLQSLRQNYDLIYFKGSKSIALQKIFEVP